MEWLPLELVCSTKVRGLLGTHTTCREEAGSTVAPESLLTHVLPLVFVRIKSAELRPGTGKTPTVNSPCDCHYAGTLIDGTEFDSSYKRGQPLTFAPNQVIKGWTEAMQLMKEGMHHHWIARANFSLVLVVRPMLDI